MKNIFLLLIFFMIIPVFAQVISFELPNVEPVILQPFAKFDFPEINESSAIIKSRVWDDVYWTLNDSGNNNRIFPFNSKGELYRAEWFKKADGGIFISNAVNIDWEEMAVDNNGNIYVCDTGNNFNSRKDLAIYVIRDPLPYATEKTTAMKKIMFYYSEQSEFPAESMNYDCEAVFWAQDNLFLLTKHRSNNATQLYRFDNIKDQKINPLKKLGAFEIDGMVTAADASIDGTKLAVLTYNNVWVFESEELDFFNGKVSWLPIKAQQCEGLCFDGNQLQITNEQMELFRIPISDLIPLN